MYLLHLQQPNMSRGMIVKCCRVCRAESLYQFLVLIWSYMTLAPFHGSTYKFVSRTFDAPYTNVLKILCSIMFVLHCVCKSLSWQLKFCSRSCDNYWSRNLMCVFSSLCPWIHMFVRCWFQLQHQTTKNKALTLSLFHTCTNPEVPASQSTQIWLCQDEPRRLLSLPFSDPYRESILTFHRCYRMQL